MKKFKIETLHDKLYIISLLFLVFAVSQYLFAILNGVINHDVVIHTDGMYLASIYQNLFVEKLPFNTFKFAMAPYLFPDFAIFLVFQTVFRNYTLSLVATSITMFAVIMMCLLRISIYIFENSKYAKSIVAICLSIYTLLVSQNVLFLSTLRYSSPNRHAGEMLVALVLISLLFRTIKKDKTVFVYPIVFILMTLTTLSDRISLKDILLPILASFLLLIFINRKVAKKLGIFMVSMTLGAVTGILFYKSIFFLKEDLGSTTYMQEQKVQALLRVSEEIASSNYLTAGGYGSQHTYFNYLRIFVPLILITYLVIGVRIVTLLVKKFKNKKVTETKVPLLILGCIALAQFALSFYAILFHSRFFGINDIRYFTLTFLLPVFWLLCFGLNYLVKSTKKVQMAVLFTVIVLALGLNAALFKKTKLGGFSNLASYQPPNTECLDEAAEKFDIKYGLGGYQDSAIYKFYSKKGVEIYKAIPGDEYLLPFYSLNSPDQFTDNNFTFFLTSPDRFPKKTILKQFGEPVEIVKCPERETEILIYNNSEFVEMLKYRFKAYFAFTNLRHEGDAMEIHGPDFDKYLASSINLRSEADKTGAEVTEDNLIKPIYGNSYFTGGPVLTLFKGNYKATLYYKTDSSNSGYALLYTFPDEARKDLKFYNTRDKVSPHSEEVVIGKNVNNPAAVAQTQYITYKLGQFALFPYYTGNGDLEIEKLVITRLKN